MSWGFGDQNEVINHDLHTLKYPANFLIISSPSRSKLQKFAPSKSCKFCLIVSISRFVFSEKEAAILQGD